MVFSCHHPTNKIPCEVGLTILRFGCGHRQRPTLCWEQYLAFSPSKAYKGHLVHPANSHRLFVGPKHSHTQHTKEAIFDVLNKAHCITQERNIERPALTENSRTANNTTPHHAARTHTHPTHSAAIPDRICSCERAEGKPT